MLAIRAFICSSFVLMILAKENAALYACLEAAPPFAPSYPSTVARAARLKKFQREQLIVDYLNRGVSVAEIAARVGVGEKRMRAVIREILARRVPHPPEEFVAIQVSRLNEALLVAFSAMTGTNLKAVDQVVKIVRELDRYGGAFAAEWRRPEASPRITVRGLDTPVEGAAAFGAAWVCGAELAPQAGELNLAADDRPENSAQRLENIESAPGTPLAPLQRGEGWPPDLIRRAGLGRFAAVEAHPAPPPGLDPGADLLPVIPGSSPGREKGPVNGRPQNPAQHLENIESAPGNPLTPPKRREGWGEGRGRLAAVGARPQNPAQRLENIESAPGKDWLDEAGSGSLPNPLVPYPIGPGRFHTTLNGMRAC